MPGERNGTRAQNDGITGDRWREGSITIDSDGEGLERESKRGWKARGTRRWGYQSSGGSDSVWRMAEHEDSKQGSRGEEGIGDWEFRRRDNTDREKSLPTMEGGAEGGRVAGERGDAVKRGVDDETEEIERDFTKGKGTCTKDDPESGVSLSNQNAASANSAEDNEHLLLTVAGWGIVKQGRKESVSRKVSTNHRAASAEHAKDSGRVCSRGTQQMKEINKMGREMHKEGEAIFFRRNVDRKRDRKGKGVAKQNKKGAGGGTSIRKQNGKGAAKLSREGAQGGRLTGRRPTAERRLRSAHGGGRVVTERGKGGKGKGSRQVEQGGSARREAHWASTDGRAASTKQ
ncbi:hypothetical protein BJ322DRAFT_1019282 [Thelephora terrestris]|uniref:Uncharacterized protein n=1 Tax=Thelephora terrestris TaxID=56493 RepID=A0A9P6HHZ4_9AGAM|nr:hypothetical protein BJ322DRAFT_1019282 [Thelephora terrestris]